MSDLLQTVLLFVGFFVVSVPVLCVVVWAVGKFVDWGR